MPRRSSVISSVCLLGGLASVSALGLAQTVATTRPGGPVTDVTQLLPAFRVEASRVNDGLDSPTVDRYDSAQITESGSFSLDEFLETLPPGREGEQLVLIDGKPTYIDPASLPLGMIEGIDVSRDGSMPLLGAYATGRVINIRLKKSYRGGEASSRFTGTLEGGGAQQGGAVQGAIKEKSVRIVYSVRYDNTDGLPAERRAISADQDHRGWGGRDLRTPWGVVPVVAALDGGLTGLTDAQGNAVGVALVNTGATRTDGLTQAFSAGMADAATGLITASGQRRFSTVDYQSLQSPSERIGFNLGVEYTLSEHLSLSLGGQANQTQSRRIGAPPVSTPSAQTEVPAAYSPFGEAVRFGLVHIGFGPTVQENTTRNVQGGVRLIGNTTAGWRWRIGVGQRANRSEQTATDLDREALAASLQNPDPALRFNPFIDTSRDAQTRRLYPSLTQHRRRLDHGRTDEWDSSASGPLRELPGGPLITSINLSGQARTTIRDNSHPTASQEAHTENDSDSLRGSLASMIPIIGTKNEKRWARRMELEVSGEASRQSGDGSSRKLDTTFSWSPSRTWTLYTQFGRGTDVPARNDLVIGETLVTESFLDPRRPSAPATNVTVITRTLSDFAEEHSSEHEFGLRFTPPALPGFEFSLDLEDTRRTNVLERGFSAQEVIDNEAAFPSRVVRLAPTADDLALGLPGAIQSVDTTPGSGGSSFSRQLEGTLVYARGTEKTGRFRLLAFARHLLDQRDEIAPGLAYVASETGSRSKPAWTGRLALMGNRGAWNGNLSLRYTGSTDSAPGFNNGVPSTTTVDLNVGYRFAKTFWAGLGRNPRIGVGLGNVFNAPAHRADTLLGFRGGSALGRTYSVQFNTTF